MNESDIPASATDETPPTAPMARRRSPARYGPLLVIIACLAAFYLSGAYRYVSFDELVAYRSDMKALVAAHPVTSVALYFLVYATLVAVSFPSAAILTVVAGFLFGFAVAVPLAVLAATTGASLLFLAARYAFGDLLRRRAGPAVRHLADGIRREAFAYLLVLRLAPIFPFFAVTIAPAFLDISLKTFALATLIGIIPGTAIYAWLGTGFDEVLAKAAASGHAPSLSDFLTPQITLALAGLAIFAAIPIVLHRIKGEKTA
ncbi:TVP38/TMEM64 family protein [Rhizobium sp. PAMB 3174]